jgi:hypothetical protein
MSFNMVQLETRSEKRPQVHPHRTAKRILGRKKAASVPVSRVPSQFTLFASTASLTLYSLLRPHFIFI